MKRLVLIAHNIRSAHNVGSLLRTADGLGVDKVYLTGYSPYPATKDDSRLPHVKNKIDRQIHKTALGAEQYVDWNYRSNLLSLLPRLKADGFIVLALEQSANSVSLPAFTSSKDIALIVGNEVKGLEEEALKNCDKVLAIPMAGQKESFNVASAGAMALYHLRFH